MILIIGSTGNMGRRYCAILDRLGEDWSGVDILTPKHERMRLEREADKIIIATPTSTHYTILKQLSNNKKIVPILCEKPLTKNMVQLELIKEMDLPLTMVFQYVFCQEAYPGIKASIIHNNEKYSTYFNFYKHGADGILWDCIQIIALAKGNILLQETSPEWTCHINGFKLDDGTMDLAYIKMIKFWIENPGVNSFDIYEAHEKVKMLEDIYGTKNHIDWHSSKK